MAESLRGGEDLESSNDAALFEDASRLPRWFTPEALQPVRDINRRMLRLMTALPTMFLLAEDISTGLIALPAQALDRLALCPCLLVDAGFHDERRWSAAAEVAAKLRSASTTEERGPPAVVALARAALFVAWHFAHTYVDAADLVIGTRPTTARALRALSLEDLEQLATAHSDWIQPRWADRPGCWQQLLLAVQTSTGSFTGELRGLQLMLGERWRNASSERSRQFSPDAGRMPAAIRSKAG